MNKKELSREYGGDISELRKIINSWGLIIGAPSDEFDTLNHKILTQLYKDADFKKISNILRSELIVYYGLFENEFDATEIASEIFEWWNSKTN